MDEIHAIDSEMDKWIQEMLEGEPEPEDAPIKVPGAFIPLEDDEEPLEPQPGFDRLAKLLHEDSPFTPELTTAQMRAILVAAGEPVGARGRLSPEQIAKAKSLSIKIPVSEHPSDCEGTCCYTIEPY